MSRFSKDQRINDKARELVAAGFLPFRGGAHWRLRHPRTGYIVTVPGTPSDNRTALNWFSQLRRAESTGWAPLYLQRGR